MEEVNAKRVEEDGFGGMEGQDPDSRFERQRNAYMLFYRQEEGQAVKGEEEKVKREGEEEVKGGKTGGMREGLEEEEVSNVATESMVELKIDSDRGDMIEEPTEKEEPPTHQEEPTVSVPPPPQPKQPEESPFACLLRQ